MKSPLPTLLLLSTALFLLTTLPSPTTARLTPKERQAVRRRTSPDTEPEYCDPCLAKAMHNHFPHVCPPKLLSIQQAMAVGGGQEGPTAELTRCFCIVFMDDVQWMADDCARECRFDKEGSVLSMVPRSKTYEACEHFIDFTGGDYGGPAVKQTEGLPKLDPKYRPERFGDEEDVDDDTVDLQDMDEDDVVVGDGMDELDELERLDELSEEGDDDAVVKDQKKEFSREGASQQMRVVRTAADGTLILEEDVLEDVKDRNAAAAVAAAAERKKKERDNKEESTLKREAQRMKVVQKTGDGILILEEDFSVEGKDSKAIKHEDKKDVDYDRENVQKMRVVGKTDKGILILEEDVDVEGEDDKAIKQEAKKDIHHLSSQEKVPEMRVVGKTGNGILILEEDVAAEGKGDKAIKLEEMKDIRHVPSRENVQEMKVVEETESGILILEEVGSGKDSKEAPAKGGEERAQSEKDVKNEL